MVRVRLMTSIADDLIADDLMADDLITDD